MRQYAMPLAAIALATLIFGGCLLVRTTEQHIRLKGDGSGSATMRFVDIRTDGEADSTIQQDFEQLMTTLGDSAGGGFETGSRRILSRHLMVDGDTLNGEVAYEFAGYGDIEGLRVTEKELSVNVSPDRAVVSTNGTIEERPEGGVRIVWDRDVTELHFAISERLVRPSMSLVEMYRKRAP